MNIDFLSGTVKVTTKGQESGTPYFKFYYGFVSGSVSPYNYDPTLDIFAGLIIKINGDIYEVPDSAQFSVNGAFPGGTLSCLNTLVASFNVYTYTNPAY